MYEILGMRKKSQDSPHAQTSVCRREDRAWKGEIHDPGAGDTGNLNFWYEPP